VRYRPIRISPCQNLGFELVAASVEETVAELGAVLNGRWISVGGGSDTPLSRLGLEFAWRDDDELQRQLRL
jgi:hypothetical protein